MYNTWHCNAFENHAGQFDDEPYPNLLPVTQLNVPPVVQDEVLKDSEKDIRTIKQGMCLCTCMHNVDRKSYTTTGLETVTLFSESHTSKSAHLSCSNGTSGADTAERSQSKSPTAHFPCCNGASATLTHHRNERLLLPEQGKLPVYIIIMQMCICWSPYIIIMLHLPVSRIMYHYTHSVYNHSFQHPFSVPIR